MTSSLARADHSPADPPSNVTATRPAARLDPSVAMAGCLVFALVLFLPTILNDSDTLWQITTGEWILDHHTVPATDPFSFTAGDRHWYAHEWLAETLMGLAFRIGGMLGVMVLAAAACGLAAAVLLHHLRRFLSSKYAVEALILAMCSAAPSLLARPHLLAWPCLVLWCGGLVTARADRRAPHAALLPVMLLWVNLHGSFMLGLLLPIGFMIEALLDPGINRRAVFGAWTRFILAAWAVALLNPDGLGGLLFPIHLLGMHSLAWIGEWVPTDFAHLQVLEVMILAGLALGFSGKMTVPPIRLLMLLGLVHAALSHARNQQLLGIVGTLVLAEPIGASLIAAKLARGHAAPLGPAWRRVSAGAALIAVVALLVRVALPLSPQRSGAAFAGTLDAVPQAMRAQPVLNEYGLGGALIFNGVRPFIDGRADLYGDEFLTRYHRIVFLDHAELERALSEYQIAWTIFPAGHALIPVMDAMPGWQRLTEVNGSTIHARNDEPRHASLGTAH